MSPATNPYAFPGSEGLDTRLRQIYEAPGLREKTGMSMDQALEVAGWPTVIRRVTWNLGALLTGLGTQAEFLSRSVDPVQSAVSPRRAGKAAESRVSETLDSFNEVLRMGREVLSSSKVSINEAENYADRFSTEARAIEENWPEMGRALEQLAIETKDRRVVAETVDTVAIASHGIPELMADLHRVRTDFDDLASFDIAGPLSDQVTQVAEIARVISGNIERTFETAPALGETGTARIFTESRFNLQEEIAAPGAIRGTLESAARRIDVALGFFFNLPAKVSADGELSVGPLSENLADFALAREELETVLTELQDFGRALDEDTEGLRTWEAERSRAKSFVDGGKEAVEQTLRSEFPRLASIVRDVTTTLRADIANQQDATRAIRESRETIRDQVLARIKTGHETLEHLGFNRERFEALPKDARDAVTNYIVEVTSFGLVYGEGNVRALLSGRHPSDPATTRHAADVTDAGAHAASLANDVVTTPPISPERSLGASL